MMILVAGGGGCLLLHGTNPIMQSLHNYYADTSCTTPTWLVLAGQLAGKQARLVAWPSTVDGTESGLALVEHTAAPGALNPR